MWGPPIVRGWDRVEQMSEERTSTLAVEQIDKAPRQIITL